MKSFLNRLIGFSIGPILGSVISFITIPITTYFIVPSEFGKASMFTVMQSFILSFIYMGMDQSYTREYNNIKNKKSVFQNAIILPFLFSFFLFIICLIFKEQVSILLFSTPEYSTISILFGMMIISSVFERFILLSIRMSERALEFSLFSVVIKLSILILTMLLIYFDQRSFLTVVYATIIGQLIGDVFLFIKYKHLMFFSIKNIDISFVKKMLLFGLPIIIASSLSNLLNTSSRFFLRGFSSFHDLGIYTAALKIAAILQIVQTAFTSFWVPTAYRWEKENKDMKHFSFIGDIVLLAMTFLFYFILFFKKHIILILSSDYSDAQYVAGLLCLSPILYTISETTTLGIVFSGKSYYNIMVSIFSIIPSLLLNYLLIPDFGTIGAGIASGFAYVVFCLSRTYFSRKCGFKVSFKKQMLCIILFFVAACINVTSSSYTFYITIVLFFITIATQTSTFKSINNIKKFPDKWDFN